MSVDHPGEFVLSRQEVDSVEPDKLISILHVWDIDYLMGNSQVSSSSQISGVELMKCLAQSEAPRVRDASISLFLLHPELANAVLEAYQTSKVSVAEQIVVLTLATLYLQRRWSFRLTMALGFAPNFPEQLFASWWQHRLLPCMGKRLYINLNPQRFAEHYAVVCQQLQQIT